MSDLEPEKKVSAKRVQKAEEKVASKQEKSVPKPIAAGDDVEQRLLVILD